MKDQLRLSIVSYSNTIPFNYALRKLLGDKLDIQVSEDIPSECARKLLNNEAEIGLVPAVMLPQLPDYRIATDYCIGADGPVASVILFSTVPLNKIEKVYLDYQSRTSVELVRILARDHWKIKPGFLSTKEGFEDKLAPGEAAVIIGDRALERLDNYPFSYDLSQEWKNFTGMPFVFAVWCFRKDLNDGLEKIFNQLFSYSTKHIKEAVDFFYAESKSNLDGYLKKISYLSENISYHLDEKKKIALRHFLKLCSEN